METQKYENERVAWHATWGDADKTDRDALEALFRSYFPSGHRQSLRSVVEQFAERGVERVIKQHEKAIWLEHFDPRAFKFLSKYGTDYRPYRWPKWPDFGFGDPEYGMCFSNSWKLMAVYNGAYASPSVETHPRAKKGGRALYVEGLCMGAVSLPMLHAWNAIGLKSRIAFDWTHAAACVGQILRICDHSGGVRRAQRDICTWQETVHLDLRQGHIRVHRTCA
jgi:hypothetical protein